MMFELGDFVMIPAGTVVYVVDQSMHNRDTKQLSYKLERSKRIKIKHFADPRKINPLFYLDKSVIDLVVSMKGSALVGSDFDRMALSVVPEMPLAITMGGFESYPDEYVLVTDVIKVAPPKTPATKTISITEKLVKGSKWKLLIDTPFYKDDVRNNWWNCRQIGLLPAGTLITITGKKRNQKYQTTKEDPHPESPLSKYKYVMSAPFKTDSNEVFWLRLDGIKDRVEELDIPEIKLYKIRDKETGLYYKSKVRGCGKAA
jgi:hypothetical protein